MNKSNTNDNIITEIQTQTRLHVQPHMLEGNNEKALVTCERACQTAVSSFPDVEDAVFYSLLEFIPYKDIDHNALRILDLPRKQRLQFKLPEINEESEDTLSATSTTSYNDIEKKASPHKKALKHMNTKFSTDNNSSEDVLITTTTTATTTSTETDTQTSLTVVPHVLEENEMAKICENVFAQVDAKIAEQSHIAETETETEQVDPSTIKTDILSELVAKVRAINDSNETKCKHYIICTTDENGLCTCNCSKSGNVAPKSSCTMCSCNSWELSSIKFALSCQVSYEEKHTQTCFEDLLSSTTTQVQTSNSESSEKSNNLDESKDEPAEGSGFNHLKAVSSAEREVISSVSQTGTGFKVSPEEKVLSSDAIENLVGCTYYETLEMSSKIPVPVNRKSNCNCHQECGLRHGLRSGSSTNDNQSGEDDKKLIYMIKIRSKSDDDANSKNLNETKTVSLNTGDGKHDTNALTEATKSANTNKCTCRKKENLDSFVPVSEIEAIYFEHYVEELQYSSTGVQTDLYPQSESVDSLPALQELGTCTTGTEIPWQKLALYTPNQYTIRCSKKEAPNEETTQNTVQEKVVTLETPKSEDTVKIPLTPMAEEEPPAENESAAEEGSPAPEQPLETNLPAEEKTVLDDTSCRDPLKLLSNSGDALLYNEPYMDIMLKLFPDPHEHCPPNETEIHWKEIIIPTCVKLRKQDRTRNQEKDRKDKYSGLFISAECKSTDVDIILKANTLEKPSCPIAVKGGAASQITISVCSSISGFMSKLKRNCKDTKLCMRVSSSQIKCDGNKGEKKSEVFAVVDAKYSSGKTVETNASSKKAIDARCNCRKVVNSKSSTYNTVTAKRNTAKTTNANCCHSRKTIETKRSTSMPNISNKMSDKCTGDSTSVCVITVKSSTDATHKATSKKQSQPSKNCTCRPSKSLSPPEAKPLKSSTKSCLCKQSNSKPSFTKQDAVAAALEVYETQMKPLKATLKELQEKVRTLNMTGMDQSYWCGATDNGLGSSTYNMQAIPSCEVPLGTSPPQYPFSQIMNYLVPQTPSYDAVPDKTYSRKTHVSADTSKRYDGACSSGKKKKSPSRKKSPVEGKAFRGCSSSNLSEVPSSAYKCPFTELAHSISNKTLSDDCCKSKYESKKSASGHRLLCVAKVSSTFDGTLFNSRRGIRTEPARSSATVKTKVYCGGQRQIS